MSALLGLGELFLESVGFSKGACGFFRLRTEVSDGQGAALDPRRAIGPLDTLFLSPQVPVER